MRMSENIMRNRDNGACVALEGGDVTIKQSNRAREKTRRQYYRVIYSCGHSVGCFRSDLFNVEPNYKRCVGRVCVCVCVGGGVI